MLESVLKRDKMIVAAALAALTALAWSYVLWLAATMSMTADMPGMDAMPGMNMPGMAMPSRNAASELIFTFAMWAVMMIGMMTPSAAPMILLYARVGRLAHGQGRPFAATGWFAGGYVLAWTGFSLVAALAQAGLSQASLITPVLASASPVFTGCLMVAAGIYQWLPIKQACLAHCQSPLMFLQRHGGFKRDSKGALLLGLKHGLYCIGCCWALMGLLFVGGVMNVLWIAALAILVMSEKVLPLGGLIGRGLGLVLVGAGIIFLVGAV